MHERISKNEANTSMSHWNINRNTWKNIKEWSQNVNGSLNHQSKCMKEYQRMKSIGLFTIGTSIELHEHTSKNEANTSMGHWTITRNTWKNIKKLTGFILWCFFQVTQVFLRTLLDVFPHVQWTQWIQFRNNRETLKNRRVEAYWVPKEQLNFKDIFFFLNTNFKAFDAPLNIVRFHPNFFW